MWLEGIDGSFRLERFAQLRLADHPDPFIYRRAQRAYESPPNSAGMQNASAPAALLSHGERNVERSEVIRGYEHDDSQYVLIEDDKLKKITPRSGRTMEIVAFVKEEQIDPIYFDSSYFDLPEKDSEKAHALLLKALEDKNRVAVATVTVHQREYSVFIRPREHGLTVHTVFFENEIRHVEGYGKIDQNIQLKPQEIKLAEQLVETLSEDFELSKYHDTFQENLKALIESKQKGRTFIEEPKPGRAPVINMMGP